MLASRLRIFSLKLKDVETDPQTIQRLLDGLRGSEIFFSQADGRYNGRSNELGGLLASFEAQEYFSEAGGPLNGPTN